VPRRPRRRAVHPLRRAVPAPGPAPVLARRPARPATADRSSVRHRRLLPPDQQRLPPTTSATGSVSAMASTWAAGEPANPRMPACLVAAQIDPSGPSPSRSSMSRHPRRAAPVRQRRGGRSQIATWGHMAPGVLPGWRPNAARRWALAVSAGLPADRPAQIAARVVPAGAGRVRDYVGPLTRGGDHARTAADWRCAVRGADHGGRSARCRRLVVDAAWRSAGPGGNGQ
jgi:hypothetical protein